jgi:predicted small lipoprotein YifL
MIRLTALRTVLGIAALAALGCGQKGPLYLPDHNGSVVTRPAGASQDTQPATQQPSPAPQTDAAPPGTAAPGATPPKKSTDKDDGSNSSPR